jgi:hypothetical protein
MNTPEIFNRNEGLRLRLAQSIDILELAFTAADHHESERLSAVQGDAITFAMAHAEYRAVTRYKETLRRMALVSKDDIGPLEASYHGIDPFAQVALDAEREYNELHPAAVKPKKTKK